MKKSIIILFSCLSLLGCTSTTGFLYDDVPQLTSSQSGPLKGSATCRRIFGFKTGDCSIGGAMAEGRISELATVKYESRNILWLYQSQTTIVTGK